MSVIHELVVATLGQKNAFEVEGNKVSYMERVNNNLIRVPVTITTAEKGFHLRAVVHKAVFSRVRASAGDYVLRLNKLIAGEALGAFQLDMVSGEYTYETTYRSWGLPSSKAICGVAEDAQHQLCRFGNLLHASTLGVDAEELAQKSIACLTL